MSIRITLLWVLIVATGLYAWKDWFKALCGLILLMALIEHPDMPKNILGFQGLNPWNILMADIFVAWLIGRHREGLVWDMPRYVSVLLLLYLGVIVVGFLRMTADPVGLGQYTFEYLVSEHLVNCVKWVVPGLLLFDGCRTRRRAVWAMCVILGLYALLAVQVIRWMPMSAAVSGGTLSGRASKLIKNEIGYSRVNMSMMLSGASWAFFATLPLVRRWRWRLLVLAAGVAVAYAQALTGGRMGYVAWGAVGFVLCSIRWRKSLLLAPLVPIAISILLPGVTERMLQGFGETDVSGRAVTDDAEVTADRTIIWPYVIDKILESPAIGYGREAMTRTGLVAEHADISFPHPHNMYLECLLDNGFVGFAMIIPFYAVVVSHAVRLFLDRTSPLYAAIGGIALALVLALLVAGMGSQTFYPREGAVGMWAAIGLMLRTSIVRLRAMARSPLRPANPQAIRACRAVAPPKAPAVLPPATD